MTGRHPTAFISYSWDNDPHLAWVRDLASRLRSDGVDVTLDQWHAVPGDQLPKFMETAIRDNDYVLIVCTPNCRPRYPNRSPIEASANVSLHLFGRVALKDVNIPERVEWTAELNMRRFELIDGDIQGTLSNDEQIELAGLTQLLREHVDSEVNLPFEGAKKLHRHLTELDSESPG